MARWVEWRIDEFELLIDLYEREGPKPAEEVVTRFRQLLIQRAKPIEPRATEPQFRSPSSIWAQLSRLDSLARPTRRPVWVPRRMTTAWERHQRQADSRRRLSGFIANEPRLDSDRETVVELLAVTEFALSLVVLESGRLMSPANSERISVAWADLQRREDQEGELAGLLRNPDLTPDPGRHGLSGAELAAKAAGAFDSLRRLIGDWRWPSWRRALRWFNVFLGSLFNWTQAPLVDSIKEVKEMVEASGEEAFELEAGAEAV